MLPLLVQRRMMEAYQVVVTFANGISETFHINAICKEDAFVEAISEVKQFYTNRGLSLSKVEVL